MKATKQHTVTKAVIDLLPGDILIGKKGGQSVVEDSSDHSGLLGFMRIETEHGHLYMELDTEVTVMERSV
jgi:phosphosulfolactate synthase (CoM biosynthesis protein A)